MPLLCLPLYYIIIPGSRYIFFSGSSRGPGSIHMYDTLSFYLACADKRTRCDGCRVTIITSHTYLCLLLPNTSRKYIISILLIRLAADAAALSGPEGVA